MAILLIDVDRLVFLVYAPGWISNLCSGYDPGDSWLFGPMRAIPAASFSGSSSGIMKNEHASHEAGQYTKSSPFRNTFRLY